MHLSQLSLHIVVGLDHGSSNCGKRTMRNTVYWQADLVKKNL